MSHPVVTNMGCKDVGDEEWPPPPPDEMLYADLNHQGPFYTDTSQQSAPYAEEVSPSKKRVPPPPPARTTSVLSQSLHTGEPSKNEETVTIITVDTSISSRMSGPHGNSHRVEGPKLSTFAPLEEASQTNIVVISGDNQIIANSNLPPASSTQHTHKKKKSSRKKCKDVILATDNISISSSEQSVVSSTVSEQSGVSSTISSTTTGCSTMSSSDSSNNNIHSHKKMPKSVLKKRKKGRKIQTEKTIYKSVSFSDNIALIACVEDTEPEEIDYMAYVEALERKQAPMATKEVQDDDLVLHNLGQGCQVIETKSDICSNDLNAKTGYDSDFDEDTSDSASETDTTDTNLCNLCQKRAVESLNAYCVDCQFYMSRFQPQAAS